MPFTPTARSIVERAAAIVADTPCDMQSSADLNIDRASTALSDGYPVRAINYALRALTFSVGIFSADYRDIAVDAEDLIEAYMHAEELAS